MLTNDDMYEFVRQRSQNVLGITQIFSEDRFDENQDGQRVAAGGSHLECFTPTLLDDIVQLDSAPAGVERKIEQVFGRGDGFQYQRGDLHVDRFNRSYVVSVATVM